MEDKRAKVTRSPREAGNRRNHGDSKMVMKSLNTKA
jgi:hypothetical protein